MTDWTKGGAHGRPRRGAALLLYRAAWEPALWIIRLCAGLEKIMGRNLWPARWRLSERLGGGLPAADRATDRTDASKTVWLHAASLGECKGLWAFAQILRESLRASPDADARILFTANTTAGLDFLRARISGDATPERWTARLAPLDHPRVAARFLRAHNVCALVLFEVELWPHWIFAARRANVPVLWISARLTARAQRRYAGNPFFAAALRRVLRDVEWIQAQTEEDARALRDHGGRAVETGGDLRGLHYLKDWRARHKEEVPRAARRGVAFVSIHARELPALVPMIAAARAESPLMIFPRKLEELPKFVKALAPHGFMLHSKLPDPPEQGARVIVDSFGFVGDALRRCRAAVIGGSFASRDRVGGHNLWEPLLAGCRIVIGPHHGNQAYLARKLAEAGLLHVLSVHEPISALFPPDENDATSAENARETFVERESETLKHAADRACKRIFEAFHSG